MTQQKRHCTGDAGFAQGPVSEVLPVTPNKPAAICWDMPIWRRAAWLSQDRAERKSIGVVENTVDWLMGGRNIDGFPGRIQCG